MSYQDRIFQIIQKTPDCADKVHRAENEFDATTIAREWSARDDESTVNVYEDGELIALFVCGREFRPVEGD